MSYTESMKDGELQKGEIMTVARTDKGTAVLVRTVGSDKAIPIFIGQLEAHSILIGLGKVPMPRPLTHDLMIGILEKTKMVLERVEITDLRDGTYYAHLILKHGVRHIDMDARPSDALALVARLDVPLYLSQHLVDEAGIPIDLISEENASTQEMEPLPDLDIKATDLDPEELRMRLKEQLDKAVEAEDYEEAARLRDELLGLS